MFTSHCYDCDKNIQTAFIKTAEAVTRSHILVARIIFKKVQRSTLVGRKYCKTRFLESPSEGKHHEIIFVFSYNNYIIHIIYFKNHLLPNKLIYSFLLSFNFLLRYCYRPYIFNAILLYR